MQSIRFQRTGKKKAPHYRVIVTEKTRDPWGKHTELLGHYNPRTKEVVLKEDRVTYWISVGAQPTDSVRNLLIKSGLIKGDKAKATTVSKKRQAKLDAKKAEADDAKKAKEDAAKAEVETPAKEAPTEEATPETPAEEKSKEAPAPAAAE